ncbi:MAG TPA: amidohydrolase family protein [Candidatus Lachnoclostridium pullistercoris]|uniref:Amidohydrolase family protein n=1 Tax=Candidatus Lachnoclostridium pullistercoris TaxID=2838632 RepID=A0A9D2P9L6_9FIRM|nr:amidohydrolase family protein [Candidatus Lachnoclostridium pullistercoris]
MYKKIDFRVRPPFGNYMKMFENDQAHFARLADAFDMTVSESQRTGSLEEFVKEMDQAQIEISVVPCRKELGATGDEFFSLSSRYPGRFVIFPYIDPMDGEQALREIDRCVEKWDIRGVSAEPTFQPKPYRFDDPAAYPMYEKLQREGLVLFVSYSAKLLPIVDPDTVRQLGTVLHDFPELSIVVGHGGWPWHLEVMAMGFNSPNIYIVPDMYGLSGAGSQDYVKSANTLMKHQMLFGTAYPILNVVDTARFYENCGIKESVLPDFFYNNAARLLRL